MKLFSIFSISDEQAMWRVQMEDDPEVFGVLVERWQRPIQNLCTRMVGDRHRGEDLAQEAFSRVFAKRQQYVATGKFSTFLWRVALNLCYDELRRIERRRETSLEADVDSREEVATNDAGPDLALAQEETARQVRAALLQLSEAYRTVLVLRHYEGLKFKEIAEVLEIPEGTVKSRMAEGLTRMAAMLGGDSRKTHGTQERKELMAL